MKKIISLIILDLFLFSTFSLVAMAESVTSYSVSNGSAKAGDTLEVDVILDNKFDKGFFLTDFDIEYDKNAMELENAVPGEILNGISTVEGGGFNFFKDEDWIEIVSDDWTTWNTNSGVITTLTFKIKEETDPGSYSVSLKKHENIGMWFQDEGANEQCASPNIISGTIKVINSVTPTYTAFMKNTSSDQISAGGIFTTDVYMAASDGKLAGGQLELDCEGGTITNIAPADGLTNSEQSDLSKISFYGNTSDATNGIKVATVTVSTKEIASGTVVLSIKDGGKAAVSGSYYDQAVTLEDATKSVTVNIKEKDQFSCNPYADASGKYLVQYTGAVEDGNVVRYTSGSTVTELYYSKYDGAWVFLADSDLSSTLTNANFSVESGDKDSATIKYDGDVNKNGTTNIVDAQIAYDISNNVYPTFEALPMEMWLSADVNKVFGVDATDARAIQCIIHGISDDSVSA